VSTHIDLLSAETVVHKTIKNILTKDEYPFSSCVGSFWPIGTVGNKKLSQQDVYDWVKVYHLPDLPQPTHPQPFDWINEHYTDPIRSEKHQEDLYRYINRLCSYIWNVLDKLNVDEHYEVIDRIYTNFFGRLAYICKETVRETTYFIP
jgi:hypothetical protein